MSDHEELESSVAAWMLGALEPDEAETMRAHVEGCAICRETAARLRRIVGALPLAVDEVAPPARLRERVLSAAAASRTTAPGVAQARRRPAARPRTRGRLLWWTGERVPLYGAAAAVVVALVAGLVAGSVTSRPGAPPSSQVARFTLAGHQQMAAAQATVIDLKSDGLALVNFSGMPALDSGRVYEVWLITGTGRADPAAVFVPDSNGGKVVLVNRSLGGYTEMAVTNEPGPAGSPQPTQQPQLYGKLV